MIRAEALQENGMLDHGAPHRFSLGQTVRAMALPRDEMVQAFEVVRCIRTDEGGMPQYRVRGVATGLERFVREVERFEPAPSSPERF